MKGCDDNECIISGKRKSTIYVAGTTSIVLNRVLYLESEHFYLSTEF